MDFEARLAQTNGRLKSAKVGVTVEVMGDRLYLRSTFPPRPGSRRVHPYQQRVALGYHANPAGLKLAEQEARKVGALLDCGEFDWSVYVKSDIHTHVQTVGDWIAKFEQDYFTRRARNPKSETTWRHDYIKVFSTLDVDAQLTPAVLLQAIASTAPDTRTRKRFVDVLSRLAKFAGMEVELAHLKGGYSTRTTEPRDIPADRLIAQWRGKIPNPSWQWAYGILATYGLRNHELFYLDPTRLPVLLVQDGKTGFRRVYPLYPEWVEEWQLAKVMTPNCSGKTNSDLGNRVTHAFKRYGIPFTPYDLRHAWAIRSLEFGMPVELAEQQMGHSVDVHCKTYHRWISEEVHQRAFEVMLMRADRPHPPQS